MISMDKKYRTRDEREVRLLCVDGPDGYPVIGIIENCGHPTVWGPDGRYIACRETEADLIEYHEPDIRTIWVNVYEGWVNIFDTEKEAKIASSKSCISVAQPVTFEVKRND